MLATAFLVLQAAPARAGSAEILCTETASQPGLGDKALDAKLASATNYAERDLAAPVSGAFDPKRLDVDLRPNSEPSPEARGAYCSAVGELARRGRYATPLDASGYLLVAFLSADQAHATDLSARAAYRLGLALTVNMTSAMGRGAHRLRGAERSVGVDTTLLAAPTQREGCDALDTLGANFDASKLDWKQITSPRALSCAATRAAQSGDKDLSALADLRLARLYLNVAAQGASPNEALQAAGDLSVARLGQSLAPELAVRLVETALDAGRSDDPALRSVVARLEGSPDIDVGVRAYASALDARIALAHGRNAAAAPLIERAIFLESQRALPSRLADWYMLLSKADPDNRAAHVRAAYVALESVRSLLPARDPLTEESTFDLHMRGVFEAAVSDALSSLSTSNAKVLASVSSGSDTAQIASVQSLVENYRQAELQNAFGNECITEPISLRSGQLRADETILYPILLPDRIELLYLRGGPNGRFQRLTPNLSFNREAVAALVSQTRRSIIRNNDDWKAPSRTLYDLLIKPVESQLKSTGTLVVIPDATLSALPFAALSDANGRFLIEKTRLDIAPGLAYAQPGTVRAGKSAYVVAASLEQEVDLSFAWFPKLENASTEARFAAGLETKEQAKHGLYIRNFTRTSLTTALREHRVDVLHLATHASFNGSTDRSFIVASGDFISITDLRQIIATNRAFGNDLDLLVLSACETAVGDDRSSLGLAGAAVQSGVHGAIASLWEVDDESTAQMIRGFYANYRQGAGKAEAMQTAQLGLLRTPRFSAPYYWAPLILVGGWR
ncbi:MAG TPA: CHAT domain-containing protein [Caulobacteraceae bacterium]|nr:CHAT domain-containing protein [Caulobacteraceae bacterium]